jgi:predicted Zn-dependent peptidase
MIRMRIAIAAWLLASCAPAPPDPVFPPARTAPLMAAAPVPATDVTPMPQVPPLRYVATSQTASRSVDAAFRISAPPVGPAVPPNRPEVRSFVLENGMHVLFVGRHAFPMVAARLVIAPPPESASDVGGRRAYLLGGTFLSPPERVLQTTSGCSPGGCFVASRGLSSQLGEVIRRIAELVLHRPDRAVYERRFMTFQTLFDHAESSVHRNIRALMFGASHAYGGPPSPDAPTLDELEALRKRTFSASASTLVVVGDVTEESLRTELRNRFEDWGREAASARVLRSSPPPLPPGPRLVYDRNRSIEQVLGWIAARGPKPGDQDAAAFTVLSEMLGGAPASEVFHHVREDLGAAYAVSASIDWYPDASVLMLGGSFEPDRAMTGVRGLFDEIFAVRDADPSNDDVERAKVQSIAAFRHAASTDEGLAAMLGGAALFGADVNWVGRWPSLVGAVSPADVHAAAVRYLSSEDLRVVLSGKPEFMWGVASLGLGEPVPKDSFGRALPPGAGPLPSRPQP